MKQGASSRRSWIARSAVVTTVGTLTLATACGSSSSSAKTGAGADKGPVLIASPVDLTGANAALGASLKAGLDASAKQINSSGGILGRQVKIDYQDTRSDAQTAAQTLTQMLASKNYAAVIPSAGGSTTLPLLQVIKAKGVLSILTGSEPDIGNPSVYPTLFDVAPSFDEAGHALGCGVQTFQPKKVGIIELDDPFNTTETDAAVKVIQSAGGQVVDREKYEMTDTNVIPEVQRVLSKNPDVLLLSTFYFKTGPVFSALQSLNSHIQVVGDTGASSGSPSSVLSSAQKIPTGMVSVASASDVRADGKLTAQQQTVINLLKPEVGTFKSSLSNYLYNYDGLQLVKFAATKAGSLDQKAMITALEGLKTHPEATGGLYESMPPYSPTNHEYGQLSYYLTDYAGDFVDGTFPAKGSVLSC